MLPSIAPSNVLSTKAIGIRASTADAIVHLCARGAATDSRDDDESWSVIRTREFDWPRHATKSMRIREMTVSNLDVNN